MHITTKEEFVKMIASTFKTLCGDILSQVREVAAPKLGYICDFLGPEIAEGVFMEEVINLICDDTINVVVATMEMVVPRLPYFKKTANKIRIKDAFKTLIKKAIENNYEKLSFIIVKNSGPFIYQIGEKIILEDEEFIHDLVLLLEVIIKKKIVKGTNNNEQICWIAINMPAFAKIFGSEVFISKLMNLFCMLASHNDEEIRKHIASGLFQVIN